MKYLLNLENKKALSKMKFLLIFTLFFLSVYSCKNHIPKENNYTIKGTINNFTGTLYLTQAVRSKYYFNNFQKDSSLVVNGKFEFRIPNKMEYPMPYFLISENGVISDKFILEPQDQSIELDSLYFRVQPIIISEGSSIPIEKNILNKRNNILLKKWRVAIKEIKNSDAPKDSYAGLFKIERDKLSYQTDSVLMPFVKEFPNSYFSFWRILNALNGGGYSKEIESAYNHLSKDIKETSIAEILLEDLKIAKSVTPGYYFPKIKLKNKDMQDIVLDIEKNYNSKYVLIDFWFSHCAPCVRQFPQLKEMYTKKHPDLLEIIGISTDKSTNIGNWNKVMDRNELPWVNFIDENGIESHKLSINKFPTNFLLDSEGKIIKKDISLEELEKLLNEK